MKADTKDTLRIAPFVRHLCRSDKLDCILPIIQGTSCSMGQSLLGQSLR